jgi:hypothetical protein
LIPTGSGGAGSNGNAQSIQTFDIRCKKIFLQSNSSTATSFSLIAGLTPIDASLMPELTASSGFEGLG